jgi:PD-(D/E)XK endonuclease
MVKRKPKVIRDKKVRGEWAESIFLARASEHGLTVSKPWGDSARFDCVVGTPGKFVAVQVKSTVAELPGGTGYNCSVCHSNRPYAAGAFDFLAAYVVHEDVWYIIPEIAMRGKKALSLYTEGGRYEQYREAWRLLWQAKQVGEDEGAVQGKEVTEAAEPVLTPPTGALGRLESSMNFFRNQLERGGTALTKRDEET